MAMIGMMSEVRIWTSTAVNHGFRIFGMEYSTLTKSIARRALSYKNDVYLRIWSYRFIPEIDRQRSCQVDVEYSRFTYRLQM